MNRKSKNKRVNEICDYLNNFELYQKFFDEVKRDIQKSLEKERKIKNVVKG